MLAEDRECGRGGDRAGAGPFAAVLAALVDTAWTSNSSDVHDGGYLCQFRYLISEANVRSKRHVVSRRSY